MMNFFQYFWIVGWLFYFFLGKLGSNSFSTAEDWCLIVGKLHSFRFYDFLINLHSCCLHHRFCTLSQCSLRLLCVLKYKTRIKKPFKGSTDSIH